MGLKYARQRFEQLLRTDRDHCQLNLTIDARPHQTKRLHEEPEAISILSSQQTLRRQAKQKMTASGSTRQLIVDTRRTLKRARGGLFRRPRLPEPTVHIEPLRSIQRSLFEKGDVLWAAVAQANGALYAPGSTDSGANIVFSPDNRFDANPRALHTIGLQVFALKSRPIEELSDDGVKALALLVRDEKNAVEAYQIPPSVTNGLEVYFSSLTVCRATLPNRYLEGIVFPILVAPHLTTACTIVPAEFWPQSMRENWGTVCDALPEHLELDGSTAPTLPLQFPNQKEHREVIEHQMQIANPPVSGVRILDPAASYIRSFFSDTEQTPRIRLLLTGGQIGIEPTDDFDSTRDIRMDSNGIEVVVDPAEQDRIHGTVIDAKLTEGAVSLAIYHS